MNRIWSTARRNWRDDLRLHQTDPGNTTFSQLES
jgi:hypothetical protein